MMPTITLKDIPRNLHRTLKARAKVHHRSLNKEVIATLEAATVAQSTVSLATLRDEAAAARDQFKREVTVREITSWKRQGRF